MKRMAIVVGCVLLCMTSYGQQKIEPVRLLKQEVVNGKKICHYADGSKITMRNATEVCPNPWRLLD